MAYTSMKILFFGDLVGKPGRALFEKWGTRLRNEHRADVVIVNGENAADNGRGITKKIATFFFDHGADAISTGNHIWAQRDIYPFLDESSRIVRPANFPSDCPGKGYAFIEKDGLPTVALFNVQGRVFMHENLSCPFQAAESVLPFLSSRAPIIFVDFHAEATSEKMGMGYFLDGRVSVVVGTHTHVQTADERVLPNGTAYITDVGCGGSLNSMIGMKKEPILQRFRTQMPTRFLVEHEGPMVLHAVCIEVDTQTGQAQSIERIRLIDPEISV